jgi:Glucose / Sorbosone dehydrogenase
VIRRVGTLLVVFLVLGCASAQALTLQQVGSFAEPTYVASDPGNPNRLFVVERQGRIVEAVGGTTSVFADIRSEVGCGGACGGERGLLSIALAPDFDLSGRLFVFYGEDRGTGAIHIAELTASGTSAPASSLRDLLTIEHPDADNHYGGQLQFGPEGNLFISTGDGGGANDEFHNAQDLGSLLGKVLRIDPDPVGLLPYTVPPGNPFVSRLGAAPEIWSYGLRNPFRFSFDRASGDLWIGDVGEAKREEVDYAAAPELGGGADYGWNCREGRLLGPATDEGCSAAATGAFAEPIFDYPHADPGDGGAFGCAVIGGYVARGSGLGDLYGRYLYADLCNGALRSFCPAAPAATDRGEGVAVEGLRSFGEDSSGRLYAVSGNGPVYRIVGPGGAACPVPPGPNQPVYRPPLAPSSIAIRAVSRRVLRHRRALITAWVTPCKGRRGDPVTLWRGRTKLGTRLLDRACSVRFRPRIDRRTRFYASVAASDSFLSAVSRKVTIRPRHRHHRR